MLKEEEATVVAILEELVVETEVVYPRYHAQFQLGQQAQQTQTVDQVAASQIPTPHSPLRGT